LKEQRGEREKKPEWVFFVSFVFGLFLKRKRKREEKQKQRSGDNNHHAQGDNKGLGCLVEGERAAEGAEVAASKSSVANTTAAEVAETRRSIGGQRFFFLPGFLSSAFLSTQARKPANDAQLSLALFPCRTGVHVAKKEAKEDVNWAKNEWRRRQLFRCRIYGKSDLNLLDLDSFSFPSFLFHISLFLHSARSANGRTTKEMKKIALGWKSSWACGVFDIQRDGKKGKKRGAAAAAAAAAAADSFHNFKFLSSFTQPSPSSTLFRRMQKSILISKKHAQVIKERKKERGNEGKRKKKRSPPSLFSFFPFSNASLCSNQQGRQQKSISDSCANESKKEEERSDGDEEKMSRAALSSFLFEREKEWKEKNVCLAFLTSPRNRSLHGEALSQDLALLKSIRAKREEEEREATATRRKCYVLLFLPSCLKEKTGSDIRFSSSLLWVEQLTRQHPWEVWSGFFRFLNMWKRAPKEREKREKKEEKNLSLSTPFRHVPVIQISSSLR
jgi:hypothetical protein